MEHGAWSMCLSVSAQDRMPLAAEESAEASRALSRGGVYSSRPGSAGLELGPTLACAHDGEGGKCQAPGRAHAKEKADGSLERRRAEARGTGGVRSSLHAGGVHGGGGARLGSMRRDTCVQGRLSTCNASFTVDGAGSTYGSAGVVGTEHAPPCRRRLDSSCSFHAAAHMLFVCHALAPLAPLSRLPPPPCHSRSVLIRCLLAPHANACLAPTVRTSTSATSLTRVPSAPEEA